MSPEDIDHEYTREIVCPWCGYEFSDSWEIQGNDESEQCNDFDAWKSLTGK